MSITVNPVAFVRGGRHLPTDDHWDAETARIILVPELPPDSLLGLSEFSHIEVIYHFHQVAPDAITTAARHPRGNPDWPLSGIFAQRGKNRPNRLGVSVARLLSLDLPARTLTVAGLDAIDGTPVLDIKPVMTEFLPRGDIRQPAWSHELMRSYW